MGGRRRYERLRVQDNRVRKIEKVVASEEVKKRIKGIGINKCARESGFDRKNFIRKSIRGMPVKSNSYNEFVRWLKHYESTNRLKTPK